MQWANNPAPAIKTYTTDRQEALAVEEQTLLDTVKAAHQSHASSSAKGSTSITQIVHHVNPEPTTEFEFAERIRGDIGRIHDPHLMVTILKVLQSRMAEIKKEMAK